MKIVKVRIRRGDLGEAQMVYPVRYNAQEVDRRGLGPLSVNKSGAYSGHIGRGGREEWCIIMLEDDTALQYAADPDMEIISEETADILMEQWRVDNHEPEEVVTDPERINAIRAKQGAGVKLSAEDLRALDPKDQMRGINRRLRSMRDVLADVPSPPAHGRR